MESPHIGGQAHFHLENYREAWVALTVISKVGVFGTVASNDIAAGSTLKLFVAAEDVPEGLPEDLAAAPGARPPAADVDLERAWGDFIPAAAFAGARPGFAFRMGNTGLGYYRDPRAHMFGSR